MVKKRKLRGHRRRGAGGVGRRLTETRDVRQRFLIVCEGEKTEPNYFRSFRVPKLVVDVKGLGVSPRQLVEEALMLREEDEYDQVWCVFDRDDCNAAEFNGAIQRASSQKVRIAYSNQAFELWYLLHFDFHNTSIPRKDYGKKLSKLLGRPYRKNDPDIYDQLYLRQDSAIRNAERLLKRGSTSTPADADPSTKVHILVRELKLFLPEAKV